MSQTYPRGTKVKVTLGHPMWKNENGEIVDYDAAPEMVGREAVIEYSYAEKYGGDDHNNYGIRFLDDGSSLAWKGLNELEFVDEGGEHLIEEAKAKYEQTTAEATDLGNITTALKSYLVGVEPANLSSAGVLKIFEIMKYPTVFHTTGEFYHLQMEWYSALPGVLHILMSDTAEQAKKAMNQQALDVGIDPVALWEAFEPYRPTEEEAEELLAKAEKSRIQEVKDQEKQNPAG